MDKDAEAFRTISEVGEELDLPQHVLRFWETRFPQIRPVKRGGGRRYYRPEDCDLLRGIKHLLYGEGYTIKGVQRILKEEGARTVQAVGRAGGGSPSTAGASPVAPSMSEEAPFMPSPGVEPVRKSAARQSVEPVVLASPLLRREPVFGAEQRSPASPAEAHRDQRILTTPVVEAVRPPAVSRAVRVDPAAPALPGFEPVASPAQPRKAKPKQLALFAGMEEEGLSSKDREALRQALEKITECRKLIAAADVMESAEPLFAPLP